MFDISHIAKLARINITEEEKQKLGKDISSILDYVEKLKQLDTAGVEPMSHVAGGVNIMRKDTTEKPDEKITEKIMEQAPSKKERHIKTRAIL